ncbi:MAG: hypothetical protein PF489_08675 [Salinivirgaceae bacterium]|jgi:tetratricopeptide (TPR) repeat protein|nr:hypothetical protein [Salinivirgaceae bacterium]
MEYTEGIKIIERQIDNYKLNDAIELADKLLQNYPQKEELLCLMGKIYTRQQKYGDAQNIYLKVLEINEDNNVAKTSITMIDNILKIRRTFYYENTYTDDDLYQ